MYTAHSVSYSFHSSFCFEALTSSCVFIFCVASNTVHAERKFRNTVQRKVQSGGLSPFLRRQIVRTALWDPDSTHPTPLDAEICRHVRNCSFLFRNPSFWGDFFK